MTTMKAEAKHKELTSEALTLLKIITGAVKHPVNKGALNWADVGDMGRVVNDLQEIHDYLTNSGEYA
jgi:hypothetical protein